MNAEFAKMATAETRLKDVICMIVHRRVARKEPLSWRLMFEIEAEAMALLERDGDLDVRYLNMMASPSAQRRPPSEEPSVSNEVYATHTALWMIQEAYHQQAH